MKIRHIKNRNTPKNQTTRRILLTACGTALMLALTVLLPQATRADNAAPPEVPNTIQVPPGNHLFREGHAIGTQNYICLSTGWTSPAYGPQATLFNEDDDQIITHFLSPNPDESDAPPRPTWQDSRDTSTVWGDPIPGATHTPDPTAIPWLLLEVVGAAEGPTGGDTMTGTTYIQRVNTTGGLKPTGSCTEGDKALVPYTADYFFYKADSGN